MKSSFILLSFFLFLVLAGCKDREQKTENPPQPPAATVQKASTPRLPGCIGCHDTLQPDHNHSFACTVCHHGNNDSTEKNIAHQALIATPGDPEHMAATCGRCHQYQVETCSQSTHFTVKKAVNLVRSHFDIKASLAGLTEIPNSSAVPQTKTQLIDDMLRRRCLRCHVYSAGDRYPYVLRGKGCAACHLQYRDGILQGHAFTPPKQDNCLSCHYASHVGADYLGRYEHDFNWEYRTPYTTREPFVRPYGVELHQLVPDIHQQRGLTCLDCHSGRELSGQQPRITCRGCHDPVDASIPPLKNIRQQGDKLILQSITDKQDHPVPQLSHPAHDTYKGQVSCQVCHAQWGFNDRATHLLLSYAEDVDAWDRLTVQSSSEVETFLEHNLYSEDDELEPSMLDAITGRKKPGIWYLGYTQRRWEDIIIKKDSDGIIKVFRPILDLQISAVAEDGQVLFDNLQGNGSGLLPYTPHTTGPAGLFYEQRFIHLLKK